MYHGIAVTGVCKKPFRKRTESEKEEIEKFKERKLEAMYPIEYMDAIRYKVRQDGKTPDKAVNIVLGITLEGKKDLLRFWLCENESASYWLNVLNEMKNIYKAPTKEAAEQYLEEFAGKWDSKYPYISRSWWRNWEELATFFKYPEEIRRLIYTTNPIESLNAQLRRVTKTKGVFPSDEALEKIIFLKISNITEKWGRMPIKNWQAILSQLMIYFEESVQDWTRFLA